MPLPLLAAAAIPMVGGLIKSVIDNKNIDKTNKENRAFALEQQRIQNDFSQAQWEKANAYNSPAEQMRRYQEAGLNPNLIYGSATNNVAQPIKPAVAEYHAQRKESADFGNLTAQGLGLYNDLRLGAAQADNIRAQATNAIQDSVLKGVQAGLALANTDLAKESLKNIPLQAQSIQADTYLKGASARKADVESSVMSMLAPYQAQSYAENTRKAIADTNLAVGENTRRAAVTTSNLKEAVARISAIAVGNARTTAETNEIKKKTDLLVNSKWLSDFDLGMRQKGIMPHDPIYGRALQGIANWLIENINAGKSLLETRKRIADPTIKR